MEASPASTRLREFVSFSLVPRACSHDGLKILIVDNDQRRASDVERQLLSFRAELDDQVKCVSHGLDALVVAEEFQPELVVMHLGLPRRSGVCTAKLLRARAWAEQVVIVSHSQAEKSSGTCSSDIDFHFYNGMDVPLLMQIYENLHIRRTRAQ